MKIAITIMPGTWTRSRKTGIPNPCQNSGSVNADLKLLSPTNHILAPCCPNRERYPP